MRSLPNTVASICITKLNLNKILIRIKVTFKIMVFFSVKQQRHSPQIAIYHGTEKFYDRILLLLLLFGLEEKVGKDKTARIVNKKETLDRKSSGNPTKNRIISCGLRSAVYLMTKYVSTAMATANNGWRYHDSAYVNIMCRFSMALGP